MRTRFGTGTITRRVLVSTTLALLLAAGASSAAGPATVTLPLFAPEVFQRSTTAPATVTRTFVVPATSGAFTLHVQNGDGATDNLVSAAVIKVNGTMVVNASELNQRTDALDRALTNLVKGNNSLEIEVRSVPSSYITVSVTGTYDLGVTITDPAPLAAISSGRVTVQGAWAGYTNDVGVAVNGIQAAISGNRFVADSVPLAAGANALKATITTFDGIRNTDEISVTATGEEPMLSLWANPASGVPPFVASFRPEVRGEIAATEYRYDFDGDGIIDLTSPTDDVVTFTYTAPGLFQPAMTAIDAAGQGTAASHTIFVLDPVVATALLAGRWENLSASLRSQDIPGSLINLLPTSREKYQDVFTSLGPQLPGIFASLPSPEFIGLKGHVAQYRVIREQTWDGVPRTIAYYVWFVRDGDGLWRIDQF